MHLSLLLRFERGPSKFNWVLMESKSLLLLQTPELDRLIPPWRAAGFTGYMLLKVATEPAACELEVWGAEPEATCQAWTMEWEGNLGKKPSPGSALSAMGNSLESQQENSRGLLHPLIWKCILTGRHSWLLKHVRMHESYCRHFWGPKWSDKRAKR